jgi:hypothetical protein
MSLYLVVTGNGNQDAAARFSDASQGEAHALVPSNSRREKTGKACFTLHKKPGDTFGFPGSEYWTLEFLDPNLKEGDFFPYSWIRIAEIPLHAHTNAALANGFQCWTESPLLGEKDILRKEAFSDRTMFGDDEIYNYAERIGVFHSWSFSYSCLENNTKNNPFFATCDEDLFHSVFEFDLAAKRFHIALETQGVQIENLQRRNPSTGALILGSWIVPTERAEHFIPLCEASKNWRTLIQKEERIPRKVNLSEQLSRMDRVKGYTSWYYHYNAITEQILKDNALALKDEKGFVVFQVDDGYQKQIGDWLTPSKGFPSGVSVIATFAKEKGFTPGIWCAPFIVTENSELYQKHPDWVLRDEAGQPVLCGIHPLWGGRFFALDSEISAVQSYVEQVLRTYFVEWGFCFLKADFLYATARIPSGGLSRATRAARAHQFLYDICYKYGAKFLSCGATLPSAYGRCDYARIGPDVGESWENDVYFAAPSREKVSTRATLTNSITRSLLNGVMFGNDPDVIILRDERCQLTRDERSLLAKVNSLFGSLVFCSDDFSKIGNWQKEEWRKNEYCFDSKNIDPGRHVQSIQMAFSHGGQSRECFKIHFSQGHEPVTLDLSKGF